MTAETSIEHNPWETQELINREQGLIARLAIKRINMHDLQGDSHLDPENYKIGLHLLDSMIAFELFRVRTHAGLTVYAQDMATSLREKLGSPPEPQNIAQNV